jgi:hypothetical protein
MLWAAGGARRSSDEREKSAGETMPPLAEAGSAQWHLLLLGKAFEKEGNRLGSSRGESQSGAGSSASSSRGASRDSTSFNPRLGSSLGSVRKGYALPGSLQDLRSTEQMLGNAMSRDKAPQTARGAMQTADSRSPRGFSKRNSPQAGHRDTMRPSTSANPREARIKQWQMIEIESRGNSRDGVRPMSSDDNNKDEMVRPMTQRDKKQMIRKSLSGFQTYFDQEPLTKVGEVPGPSMVQSASVSAYIQMDHSDMSDDELLHKLSQSSTAPRLKVPPTQRQNIARRAERLDQDRKEKKGAGVAWGGPKRPGLSKVASDGSDPAQARQFEPEFKSAGLFAHTELERLRTVDESRKNPKPEEARVAHCCSLLERLQVKYFDEELAMLKQELFRAIFHDVETLKQLPEPRSRDAFLGAEPYFQLWQAQKDKVAELEMSMKAYQAEAQNAKEMYHQVESRLRFLTGGGGNGLGGSMSVKGQVLQGEAGHSESMLRGSVPSLSVPSAPPTPLSKMAHLNAASYTASQAVGEVSTTWPIYDGAATPPPSGRTERGASTWMRSSIKPGSVCGGVLSPMNTLKSPHSHSFTHPHSFTHSSLNVPFAPHLHAAAAQGSGKQENPFLAAAPTVKLVASEIDNLETYLRLYRDALSVEEPSDAGAGISGAGIYLIYSYNLFLFWANAWRPPAVLTVQPGGVCGRVQGCAEAGCPHRDMYLSMCVCIV